MVDISTGQATEFLLKEVDPALRAALPSHLSASIDPNRSHLGTWAVHQTWGCLMKFDVEPLKN